MRRQRFSVLCLLLVLLLLLPQSHGYGLRPHQLFVTFRNPSRNTMGFRIGHKQEYVLPQMEFLSAFNATNHHPSSSTRSSSIALRPLTTQPTIPFYRIERVHSGDKTDFEDQLAQTVQRCILAYGLFRLLATGESLAAAAANAASLLSRGAIERDNVHPTTLLSDTSNIIQPKWRVGVVDLQDEPNSNDNDAVLKAFHPYFHANLDLALQQRNEKDPPPDLDFVIFLLPNQAGVLLCRRLAQGPAIGKGYSYSTTPRRPRGGILKRLAERRLEAAFSTPTAMEPEIAWVMSNLARVRVGSKVLDPFVGSGSLLFAASLLGAGELVGTDAAVELVGEGEGTAKGEIMKSFVYGKEEFSPWVPPLSGCVRPPVHFLGQADILTWENYPLLFRREYYDCIVTDPPYDLKAKVQGPKTGTAAGEGETDKAKERQQAAMPAIVKLMEMAAHVLVPGGRIVFFLPVWGKHDFESRKAAPTDSVSPPSALPPLPSVLRPVTALPQVFSPTFVRWLVCVEKRT